MWMALGVDGNICQAFAEICEFFSTEKTTFLKESLEQSSNISCGWVTYMSEITAHTNLEDFSQTRAA